MYENEIKAREGLIRSLRGAASCLVGSNKLADNLQEEVYYLRMLEKDECQKR
jgi:hypothetical protein